MFDWKSRFYAPQFPWSEVAQKRPDRGLAVIGKDLAAWELRTGELRPVVHRPHGVVLFAVNRMIDPLGRWIYYMNDDQGNEVGHLARVPFEGGESLDLTAQLPAYAIVGLSTSGDGKTIALNTACGEGYSLRTIDADSLETKLVYRAEREFIKSRISADGNFLAVMSTERAGRRHYAVRAFDSEGAEVGQLWDESGGNFWLTAYSPLAHERLILASGLKGGRRVPILWDPVTDEREWLDIEDGEITPLDWSADGRRLLLSRFLNGEQSLLRYDLKERKASAIDHPPGAFGEYGGSYARYAYFGPDHTVHAHRQDSQTPLRLEIYGKETQVLLGEDPPPARPWKNVSFESSDGTSVQAWLAQPEGAGPFPTILSIHGGPHLVMTEVFCPSAQAWLDHGFAFLSLNYRGSTTFGCRFQEMIWGNLGHYELEDLVAAHRFLVAQAKADPQAIFLNGESYGGFLTLWGLAKRPELWAGGMAGVALTDWTETYRDASAALQGAFRNWFGGSPEEVGERYHNSSPINFVQDIQAPVLLLQGKNDSRTPPRQARLFEQKMKDAGKRVQLEWFDGGHAMEADTKVRWQQMMLNFTQRILAQTSK